MHVGRKLEDNLAVFNVSIVLREQVFPDLFKTLKSFPYYSGVLGQISFPKGKFSDFLAHTFTISDFVLGLIRIGTT
jgi:hypothetical protein